MRNLRQQLWSRPTPPSPLSLPPFFLSMADNLFYYFYSVYSHFLFFSISIYSFIFFSVAVRVCPCSVYVVSWVDVRQKKSKMIFLCSDCLIHALTIIKKTIERKRGPTRFCEVDGHTRGVCVLNHPSCIFR